MLKELLEEKKAAEGKIAPLQEQITAIYLELSEIEKQICAIIDGPVNQVRMQTGNDTGTVDVLVQGVMVKHSLPKKVDWDQEKLAECWRKIEGAGDVPENYIDKKVTYKVPEKKFEKFIPEIKSVFTPARTVGAGKATVSFNVNR